MTLETLKDQGAAFLAASLLAKSDKIQSTRFIIDLWVELRKHLKIKSRIDYLAVLLSQGRLMDLKIGEDNYLEIVQDSLENIHRELVVKLTYPILGEKNGSELLAETYIVRLNDIASAMIASAVTDLSSKVESTKEIVDIWDEIRETNIIQNNNEYLTALLVTSRINDLKKELGHQGGLNIIIENFRNLLLNLEPTLKVTKIDLAAAYLTIAVVTQTPEIESHGQIINIWKRFKDDLELNNTDLDIIASILTAGLIRNMTMKLDFNYIKELYTRIWNRLQEVHITK